MAAQDVIYINGAAFVADPDTLEQVEIALADAGFLYTPGLGWHHMEWQATGRDDEQDDERLELDFGA